MVVYVICTYWWGNRICNNSKRDFLKVTTHPVSYQTLARRLATRCRALGLPFYSEEYANYDHQNGILYKPLFIRKTIERFRKPVLYIDCDIFIHHIPKLIDATDHLYDFMAFNWLADTRINPVFDWHTLVTHSDVLYFNYTQKALFFLNEWRDAMLQNPDMSDDELLSTCFMKYKDSLNYYWLPGEYFYVPQYMKCKIKPVLSHPFFKTNQPDLQTENPQFTHILEYIPNKSLLPCIQARNKGFKKAGLLYEYRFDPPRSSPIVVTCPEDSTSPTHHDTDSSP